MDKNKFGGLVILKIKEAIPKPYTKILRTLKFKN